MDQDKFYDRGYKRLFSHPRMVEDLIKSFVREDFVRDINFGKLKRDFDSFITEEFRERESDIIWQVEYKGRPAYLYILIEFQSTVDHYMALRMLLYLLLFYQELIKYSEYRDQRLPPVFPILLYNGDEPWSAPVSLEELLESPSPSLSAYMPSFRYCRIVERDFLPESLLELNTLTSNLFLIETGDTMEIGGVVERIIAILEKEVDKELKRSFGLWLNRLFEKRRIPVSIDIEKLSSSEVRTVLETNLRRFEEEALTKGRQEGRIEGEQQKAREVAKKLKESGIDAAIIAESTGLSVEDLNRL
ncbi:MAG: Rpn family recombination-promoting nuclease/putative transposase [Candidatus Xenobiia bacterium LiM19]